MSGGFDKAMMRSLTGWQPPQDADVFASVSGGKDSTALLVYLLRTDCFPFRAVFYDTGWEHPETYKFVRETIPARLGVTVEEFRHDPGPLSPEAEEDARKIEEVMGVDFSAFVRLALKKAMFPGRTRRFCTEYLKIACSQSVVAASHRAGRMPVMAVGVRGEESEARAKMPDHELSTSLDSYVWRPLLHWSLDDVIAAHHYANIEPNPLYMMGAHRVGCWPCIMARKAEIRMVADHDPGRAEAIRLLEAAVQTELQRRSPDPLRNPPTLYQAPRRDADGKRPCVPWDYMAEWSRTPRGGQLGEVDEEPDPREGCMRWGLCDVGDGGDVEGEPKAEAP